MKGIGAWLGLVLVWAAMPTLAQETTFYQCVAADGGKTIQNKPCPPGSTQETRVVQGVRSFPTGEMPLPNSPAPSPPPAAQVPAGLPEGPAPAVAQSAGREASSSPSSWAQPVISAGPSESTTFYQCTAADGNVTIQSQPCPPGSRQETRMVQGVRSFSIAPAGAEVSGATVVTPEHGASDANGPSPTSGNTGAAAATSSSTSGPPGPPISGGPVENITFYRCTDAEGAVMIRNQPCPRGSRQEKRVMQGVRSFSTASAMSAASLPSPQDSDPGTPSDAGDSAVAEAGNGADSRVAADAESAAELPPPPALSRCTTPEGGMYFSEIGTPGERCVPLRTVGLNGNPMLGAGEACEIVRDECTPLSDRALCDGWRQYLGEAESSWRFAHPDNVESRLREFQRLGKIVGESQCAAPE